MFEGWRPPLLFRSIPRNQKNLPLLMILPATCFSNTAWMQEIAGCCMMPQANHYLHGITGTICWHQTTINSIAQLRWYSSIPTIQTEFLFLCNNMMGMGAEQINGIIAWESPIAPLTRVV